MIKQILIFNIFFILISLSVCHGRTIHVSNLLNDSESGGIISFDRFVDLMDTIITGDPDEELDIIFKEGIYKSTLTDTKRIEVNIDGNKIKFKKINIYSEGEVLFDGGVDLVSNTWTKISDNIWSTDLDITYDISAIWLDGKWAKRKYPDKDNNGIDIPFSTDLLTKKGEFLINTEGDKKVIYLYSNSNPSTSFSKIEYPGSAEYCFFIKNVNELTIKDLKFKNFYCGVKGSKIFRGADIVVSNFNKLDISKCHFEYSFAGIIALSGSKTLSGDATIYYNTFNNNYCHFYPKDTIQYDNWLIRVACKKSVMHSNVIDGTVDIFVDNVKERNSAFGIVLQQLEGYPLVEYSRIYNNTVSKMGRTGIGAFDTSNEGVDKEVDIVIYNNYIHDGLENYSSIYSNSIDCDAIGIGGSTKHTNLSWKNIIVRNNVIENFGHTGIHLANKQGKDFEIKDNIIINCPTESTGFAAIRANNGCKVTGNLIIQGKYGFGIAEDNKNEVNTVYGNIILRDDKYKPAIRLLQVSKEYPVLDLSNRIINVGNMELIKAAMWSDSEIRNKYKKFYNTVTINE